jgi:hypothetical protein
LDFTIASNTCIVGVPSLLHNGAVTAALADTCAITVTFNPATLGAKSAQIAVQTAAITRTVPLTGTGTAVAAAAAPVALTAERNRPASIDLEPLTSGANVIGVQVSGAPSRGIASVDGFVLTYTPDRDYVGPDSLTYETISSVPEVPATATITVTVVPPGGSGERPGGGRPGERPNAERATVLACADFKLPTPHALAPPPARHGNGERQDGIGRGRCGSGSERRRGR